MERYHAFLYSPSGIGNTNLQLYSLQKAAEGWNELVERIKNSGRNNVDHYQERLSFIVCTLGLSLFQLIGQNHPMPDQEKMGKPHEMLSKLLNQTNADRTTCRRLKNGFKKFLKYYDAIRHFGRNKDDENYRTVDCLTIEKLNSFREMTIEIWDFVIDMYRQCQSFSIEISSVSELVNFTELNEREGKENPLQ